MIQLIDGEEQIILSDTAVLLGLLAVLSREQVDQVLTAARKAQALMPLPQAMASRVVRPGMAT